MKTFKLISKKMFALESKVILSVVYILIMPAFFLIYKSKEKKKVNSWLKWVYKSNNLEDLKKQY